MPRAKAPAAPVKGPTNITKLKARNEALPPKATEYQAQILQEPKNGWYWQVVSPKGHPLFVSSEYSSTRSNAERSLMKALGAIVDSRITVTRDPK